MIKYFSLFFAIVFLFFIPFFSIAYAQNTDCGREGYPDCPDRGQSDSQLGCGQGFGPFASLLCEGNANEDDFVGGMVNTFFSNILGLLTAIAGLYFFFQIITAGIAWVGAGGDKNNVEQARNKIINALIGLIVVASAWILVGIVGQFIGFNILDTGSMIDELRL